MATISVKEPIPRRALEAVLVFEHGHDPQQVTKTLQSMVASGRIARYSLDRPGAVKPAIYTTGRAPAPRDLKRLGKVYDMRDLWLPNVLVRDAGERYVRMLFIASSRYAEVTQRQRLGAVVDRTGKHAADLMVSDIETSCRFTVSVKNQREIIFAGHRAIADCYSKAKAHGARPWLFAPFATQDALIRCKRDGIRLTILGRQIVPAEDASHQHMWWVLRQLEPINGPQPFEILYAKPRQTLRRSALAQRDVQMLDAGLDTVMQLKRPENRPTIDSTP